LQRVAIVDFDVHHGNGTEDIFRDDPQVLMVSFFSILFIRIPAIANRPVTWSTCPCRRTAMAM
jgi:acetoin utilization deacetylase AcuC-like enzyme